MMQSNFDESIATEEAKLLVRLKAGEQSAWAEFFQRYAPPVYTYLLTSLPDIESAEDVLSETLMASVKAVQTFDSRVTLRALLFSLAQRKLADFWRRRSAQSAHEENIEHAVPLDEIVHEELLLQEALRRLPMFSQHTLLLRYVIGLRIEEIADVFGRTHKAVESLLSRARQQLAETLADLEAAPRSPQRGSTAITKSIVQMLTLQVQRCENKGMDGEAAIFANAAQQLQEMTALTASPIRPERRSNNPPNTTHTSAQKP